MNTKVTIISALTVLLAASCSTDTVDESVAHATAVQYDAATADDTVNHTLLLIDATVTPFDSERQTRAADWQWQDGDVIFLQYHAGNTLVRGYAVYSKAINAWDCYYSGTLPASGTCEVYYFEGADTSNKRLVSLTGVQGIFSDTAGKYAYSDSAIMIEASLTPATSRMRFKGTADMGVSIGGITSFTAYNADNNVFTTTSDDCLLTVASTGYTPYVCGVFTDATKRELCIRNNYDGYSLTFTRAFSSSFFQKGKSGKVTVPRGTNHVGWVMGGNWPLLTFSVSGNGLNVSFKMRIVEPGTFQMGSNSGSSIEMPVHSVTLTKAYYMGETEVTQALWQAVMGYKPTSGGPQWTSSNGLGDDYPAYYISYTDCQEFITKLNAMTGQQFRMPTEAEWEFAARGGTKSKGYTYAGSNTIDDVAWYYNNSGSKTHAVGGKQPNELGLYDMSGNVYEWCADWYGSYTSGAQTNPTGPTTGSSRVIRGGSWFSGATYCRTALRNYYSPGYRGDRVGFRLAL